MSINSNGEIKDSCLLFRWGFLIKADTENDLVAPSKDWPVRKIGAINLAHHPDTHIRTFTHKKSVAILIGFCFGIDITVDDAISRLFQDPYDYSVLNDLSGRFCLVLALENQILVFNDPFGAQTLYYSTVCSSVVASHAFLLAKHTGADRSEKVNALMRSDVYKNLSVKYLPGDLTDFNQVHGVIPNHFLNLNSGTLTRYWPLASPAATDFDQFVDRFERSLRALASALAGKEVYLGVTGGIDTRVLMAGLTRAGCSIRGMTWLGNYHDPKERTVIDKIVQRLAMDHVTVDMPGPSNEISHVSACNNGVHRGQSRLTSGVAEGISCSPNSIFVRGYGGEIIRGFYNLLKSPMVSLEASEQARMYFRKSSREDSVAPQIREIVTVACNRFFNVAGYHKLSAELDFDPNDVFYWEQRMGMWAAGMLNEMDAAMYSIVGLNDRRLYEIAFGLPRPERLTKALFQRLIDCLEPRLSNLPVV